MFMKIKITKKGSKGLEEFHKKEWAHEDLAHYGKPTPWESWKSKHFTLEIYDNNEIAGSLVFVIIADVAYIDMFIVARKKRNKGIGKLLLNKTEEIAKKHNAHKIYLHTGENWEATTFYKSLGYKKTGDLPNHFFHKDFIEMTKFL